MRHHHLHHRQPPPPPWWPFFAMATLLHSTSRPFEEQNHIATMVAKAGQPQLDRTVPPGCYKSQVCPFA